MCICTGITYGMTILSRSSRTFSFSPLPRNDYSDYSHRPYQPVPITYRADGWGPGGCWTDRPTGTGAAGTAGALYHPQTRIHRSPCPPNYSVSPNSRSSEGRWSRLRPENKIIRIPPRNILVFFAILTMLKIYRKFYSSRNIMRCRKIGRWKNIY